MYAEATTAIGPPPFLNGGDISNFNNNFSITDTNDNLTSNIIRQTLGQELSLLLSNTSGSANLRSATIKTFLDKLYTVHYNTLNGRSQLLSELFILHHISKGLYRYNQQFLNLSYNEFRSRILYPNLVYILVRYLNKANVYFRNIIKNVYEDIKRTSFGIILRHESSYYLDSNVIKTDVLYEFLGNGLRKFCPIIDINNINLFYKASFKKVFHYYFMSDEKGSAIYSSLWDTDELVSRKINVPTRLTIYRDILYALQVKKFCDSSHTLNQINYNFNIFRNVIVNNEIQNMYYTISKDTFMLDDNNYKLLKIYNLENNDTILTIIKDELPLIYKLLKCVHIINPKVRPYNEMLIKPNLVKSAVFDELIYPFRNMLAENHIHGILDKVAQNFVDNILTGEYINLLTLSPFEINQISFITQLRKFVNLCIKNTIPPTKQK